MREFSGSFELDKAIYRLGLAHDSDDARGTSSGESEASTYYSSYGFSHLIDVVRWFYKGYSMGGVCFGAVI
jgi:hypothetical protein